MGPFHYLPNFPWCSIGLSIVSLVYIHLGNIFYTVSVFPGSGKQFQYGLTSGPMGSLRRISVPSVASLTHGVCFDYTEGQGCCVCVFDWLTSRRQQSLDRAAMRKAVWPSSVFMRCSTLSDSMSLDWQVFKKFTYHSISIYQIAASSVFFRRFEKVFISRKAHGLCNVGSLDA